MFLAGAKRHRMCAFRIVAMKISPSSKNVPVHVGLEYIMVDLRSELQWKAEEAGLFIDLLQLQLWLLLFSGHFC
jgi:hypothetical protein